ncbi:hypothetical protein XANCAGTX0491_003461 [Xanthoria calcicola]
MASTQGNDALARLNQQKHLDADVAAQQAALARSAKERAHRKNKKLKERVKRNNPRRPKPYGVKMAQLRRWMMNEQRKEDKGGITQEGFYALSAWSKEPEGGGGVTLAPDAEQGKDRFMAEWEAASQEQGSSSGLEDWWMKEPSYKERTGQENPAKEYWKLVKEHSILKSVELDMMKPGHDSQNTIVVDDSDEDESGNMVAGMTEGVEIGLQGGISGEMVLRGPKLSSAGSEDDLDGGEGGVQING